MDDALDHSDGWRPCASLEALKARARMLGRLREFFAERDVLEVETPVLAPGGATDPNLESFTTRYRGPGADQDLYLQTSPEFPMKRLLAAGIGSIYQVCRVFRNGERGRLHNPEFTMLEWYRPGFDHHDLMTEVEQLVVGLVENVPVPESVPRLTYGDAFSRWVGVDPHRCTNEDLVAAARRHGLPTPIGLDPGDRPGWLDLLLIHLVEPRLEELGWCFLYDFPSTHAALARIRPGEVPVAERFELYVNGVELANGFHELGDAAEQRKRFEADQQRRERGAQPPMPMDRRFLAALDAGLPSCAGVALGLDRLLMLDLGQSRVDAVLAFPFDRA